MDRDKLQDLIAWKNKSTRKPLIVRGARQVGKTWLLKEFGRTQYRQYIYVNFENAMILQDMFLKDFDINRIIQTLQIYAQTQITPEDTLIIFDEVQAAERVQRVRSHKGCPGTHRHARHRRHTDRPGRYLS